MNRIKIALILSFFFILAGCEDSSTNNTKDYNDTIDDNISLPIEDENSTDGDDNI